MCMCSLVILTIRITVHSIVHTNISSTSVDGITMLMVMIMVDTGRLVSTLSCVGKKDEVEVKITGKHCQLARRCMRVGKLTHSL